MANERLDPGVSILTAESDPWAKASLRRIFKEFQFSNVSYSEDVYKTTHQGRFEKFSLLLIGSDLDKGDSVKVVGQIRARRGAGWPGEAPAPRKRYSGGVPPEKGRLLGPAGGDDIER